MMGADSAIAERSPIKLNKDIRMVFVRIRYTSAQPDLHCKCNEHLFDIVLDFNGLY